MSYMNILNQIIDAEQGVCSIDKLQYKVISANWDSVTNGEVTEPSEYQYFRGVILDDSILGLDRDQFAIDQLQAEVDECVDFATIADQVPYLGQFLCNFEFFDEKHSGLMSETAYNGICEILDNMRINNTILKMNTPAYYNILYTIAKKHAEMETLAEQYQAEWRVIADKIANQATIEDLTTNMTTAQDVCNRLTSLFSEEYFDLFFAAYGVNYKTPKITNKYLQIYNYGIKDQQKETLILATECFNKVYPEWQTWINNLEYAEEQYRIHQSKLWSVKAQLKTASGDDMSPNKIMLESELESENNYLKTYGTLKSSWTINPAETDDTTSNSFVIPGKWSMLLGILYTKLADRMNKVRQPGLSATIEEAERANERQMQLLYTNYGDFIYETTYENTDELDSVGLYNQTVNNFALYNKPAASYSMTVIDLNCLEQISIPNATVGSKIRVYNELLNLKDGENNNNNLQYTDNNLTITAISRKLRSADDVSFTVQKTNRINKLVEKLLINL